MYLRQKGTTRAELIRQLFGRGGRQGDPGSHQMIVSLEDDFISEFYGKRLLGIFSGRRKPLPGWLGYLIVTLAQISAESYHSRLRRELLKQDDNLSDMLAFSGRGE